MPGAQHLSAYSRSQLPSWYYLGGQCLVNPANTALTLPSEADTVVISSETGPCYYGVDVAIVGTNAPGYVATGAVQTVGPIANLTSFMVHAPAATVHVQYWREAS